MVQNRLVLIIHFLRAQNKKNLCMEPEPPGAGADPSRSESAPGPWLPGAEAAQKSGGSATLNFGDPFSPSSLSDHYTCLLRQERSIFYPDRQIIIIYFFIELQTSIEQARRWEQLSAKLFSGSKLLAQLLVTYLSVITCYQCRVADPDPNLSFQVV